VAIHPSSTLFGLPALPSEQEKWLIYHEKVKTSKVYIRDGTLVAPYPLLLFGGQIDVHHEKQMIELDKWILFRANAKVIMMCCCCCYYYYYHILIVPCYNYYAFIIELLTGVWWWQVGVLMKKLRRELDKLLLIKIEDPKTDVTEAGQSVIDTIVTLVATENQQETADTT
jgi:hypothetical protein